MDKVARSVPAINTVIGSKCARAEQEAHNQTSPTINMLIIHAAAPATNTQGSGSSSESAWRKLSLRCSKLLFIEIYMKNRIQ